MADTLFYQPLNRDRHVNLAQWQQLLHDSRQQGITALVVQWSRYGEQDFLTGEQLLPQVLAQAQQQGMRLWLGLSADPDYFRQMQQPFAQRQHYFRQQLALALVQMTALAQHPLVQSERFAGWYLPFELNEQDFQTVAEADWLIAELSAFRRHTEAPVAISAYSNAQLPAALYLIQLNKLADSGLTLWLQDGGGAELQPAAAQQQLLAGLDCRIGVIIEAFRQPDYHSDQFSARKATAAELSAARQRIKPCHSLLYFSLRYMPWNPSVLPLTD